MTLSNLFDLWKIAFVSTGAVLKTTVKDFENDEKVNNKSVYESVKLLKKDLLFLKNIFEKNIICNQKKEILKFIDENVKTAELFLSKCKIEKI